MRERYGRGLRDASAVVAESVDCYDLAPSNVVSIANAHAL